jgi:deoxyribose-phosphate aldolase
VPTVDQVMAEERAAAFTRRSIKTSAKLEGLKLAVSMMDLTTLEGNDTPGKIAFLCRNATARSSLPGVELRGRLRLSKSR